MSDSELKKEKENQAFHTFLVCCAAPQQQTFEKTLFVPSRALSSDSPYAPPPSSWFEAVVEPLLGAGRVEPAAAARGGVAGIDPNDDEHSRCSRSRRAACHRGPRHQGTLGPREPALQL